MAAFDHQIGIGTDERDLALGKARQRRAVMLRRFGFVVIEAGTDDRLSIFRRNDLRSQAFEQRQVALGTDEEDLFGGGGDQRAGHIARGHDPVVGFVRHAETADLDLHTRMRTRRVGDQHHSQAGGTRLGQRLASGGKGLHAVMKNAPDIAQHHVVARSDFPKTVDPCGHSGFLQTRFPACMARKAGDYKSRRPKKAPPPKDSGGVGRQRKVHCRCRPLRQSTL
ncbi:hypothetical protein D9M72_455870 [compost metagenome]